MKLCVHLAAAILLAVAVDAALAEQDEDIAELLSSLRSIKSDLAVEERRKSKSSDSTDSSGTQDVDDDVSCRDAEKFVKLLRKFLGHRRRDEDRSGSIDEAEEEEEEDRSKSGGLKGRNCHAVRRIVRTFTRLLSGELGDFGEGPCWHNGNPGPDQSGNPNGDTYWWTWVWSHGGNDGNVYWNHGDTGNSGWNNGGGRPNGRPQGGYTPGWNNGGGRPQGSGRPYGNQGWHNGGRPNGVGPHGGGPPGWSAGRPHGRSTTNGWFVSNCCVLDSLVGLLKEVVYDIGKGKRTGDLHPNDHGGERPNGGGSHGGGHHGGGHQHGGGPHGGDPNDGGHPNGGDDGAGHNGSERPNGSDRPNDDSSGSDKGELYQLLKKYFKISNA